MGKMKSYVNLCLMFGLVSQTTRGSIKIPGNVTVIGLFQIHEPSNGKCGSEARVASVMVAEAVKWYFEELNQYGQLPFSIGFEAEETCRLEYLAAEITNDVICRLMNNEAIGGIIGPEFSSEAEVISKILSSYRPDRQLAQVGFSTTSVELTTDGKYQNFIRVIPNDDIQVEMMIQSMKLLQWNRIALIYEDDKYGQDAASRLLQRAELEGICISLTDTIDVKNGISIVEVSGILNKVIIGENSRPTITAVVLFASSTTVKTIFRWLSTSGLSSVPIFMISDAMNMDTNVFKSITGDVLPKSKGSLVFSPPYREVSEFADHWKTIFTNSTKFQQEYNTNSWLLDVFHSVTNCDTKDCMFSPLSDERYETEFGSKSLYVQYAVLAAHALAKGLKIVWQNDDEYLSDVMKGMAIDLSSDFQWSPQSISDLRMTLTSTGDPKQGNGAVEYQLYNFQDTGDKFDLIKVGERIDGLTNISFHDLRDYTESDEKELSWPNTRKGQCLVGSFCTECVQIKQLYDSFIHEPGDIYVVGVVPIFDTDNVNGCGNIRTVGGYQAAEAIRFAAEKVNARTGDFAALFAESKVGVIILNSCNNPVEIQRKLYEIHTSGITLSHGTKLDVKDKIVGFVAELVSDVSIAVAETLSRLKFVQVSYASTLPALGDKSRFPYFMRVVTPVDSQGEPIIKIVKELNGDYIQLVYSSTAYGEAGRDAVHKAATENGVCVIQDIAVQEESNPNEIYDKLRKYPHARIVVIFLQSHKVLTVMTAVVSQIYRGEFTFIGSQTWHRRTDILDKDVNRVLTGSYSLSFEIYQDQALRTHLQVLYSSKYRQDPWSLLFLQTKYNCYYDTSFDKRQTDKCLELTADPNFALDYMDTNAYIATLSLLSGVDSFLSSECSTQRQLCEEFKTNPEGLMEHIKQTKLDLDGSGNKMRVFNSNGDGNLGYRIYNIQRDSNSLNMLEYIEVGRSPLEGTFTFEKEKTVNPTEEEIISVCPNAQACSGCYSSEKPTGDSESEKRTNGTTVIVLAVILGCALLCVCVLTMIVVKLYRKLRGFSQDDIDPYLRPTYIEGQEEVEFTRNDGLTGDDYLQEIPPRPHQSPVSDIPTTEN